MSAAVEGNNFAKVTILNIVLESNHIPETIQDLASHSKTMLLPSAVLVRAPSFVVLGHTLILIDGLFRQENKKLVRNILRSS